MKNLILAVCFISIIQNSFSQSIKGIGFLGGANISKLTNANLDSKTNAYFGMLYQVRLSNIYALQPELGYSNQGGKTKDSDNLYVEYLTLGFTNKLFLSPETGFYMLVAPSFDFDIDDTFFGFLNRNDEDGNDVTFIDFSLSFGLGIEFKNGLAIEARYKQGLIDVYSGSFHNFESELYESKNQFNSVFQIGLTYTFLLTKKE
ncbi:MAG TPA: hypothetical protein DCE27_13950 [Xanthomarina gelatinilytica]|nr:hypothetical protein [Xanthomarina gelatinilytica]